MNISGGIKVSGGGFTVKCHLTPPTAPTIGAASWNTGTTSTYISFTGPSSTGGFPITSYNIVSSCGAFSTTTNSIGTALLDGLTPGNTYTFYVSAVNLRGAGCASPQSVSVQIGTPPAVPTCISAVATSCSAEATVSYRAPTNNGGFPVTSYTAISTPGNMSATVYTSASGSITVLGLTQSVYYSFNVYATNAAGNSALSLASNTMPEGVAPSAPTGISASSTLGSTTATVFYTASTSSGGFTITSYTAVSTPGNITATVVTSASGSISVTGLTLGNNYTFKVYASNLIGNGALSTASNSVSFGAVPSAPTGISAALSGCKSNAVVSYTASSSNGGFPISSYTAVSTPGNITATVATSASGSITVTGLSTTTGYTFTVYSTNMIGNSPSSTASNAIHIGSYSASYLIVAGGGGGGNNGGGGGGAGGALPGITSVTPGTVYTVVVGAGAVRVPCASAGYLGANGFNGNNSTAFGLTAVGGGGGGTTACFSQGGPGIVFQRPGLAGGSGGGASGRFNGYSAGANAGGAGTPGQGYPGGSICGGGITTGGGGAGGPGYNTGKGCGGTGTATTLLSQSVAISLSVGQYVTATNAVYFAGGGGGACSASLGGWGGGGSGKNSGLANTGGGGGGAGFNPSSAGGSGIVIVSLPTSSWPGVYTGTATVTAIVGTSTVIVFKASGTFTA